MEGYLRTSPAMPTHLPPCAELHYHVPGQGGTQDIPTNSELGIRILTSPSRYLVYDGSHPSILRMNQRMKGRPRALPMLTAPPFLPIHRQIEDAGITEGGALPCVPSISMR